jgi:hypothetical protein
MAYAKGTEVSVDKTESEIKGLLRRYKADSFASFESGSNAMIAFEMQGRRIVFKLPLPDRNEKRFTHTKINQHSALTPRPADVAFKVWDQACRERWRALLLCIKAKLESVDSGIETFEDAFLSHVMMPNGQTIGEMARPQIKHAYETDPRAPLLLTSGARP